MEPTTKERLNKDQVTSDCDRTDDFYQDLDANASGQREDIKEIATFNSGSLCIVTEIADSDVERRMMTLLEKALYYRKQNPDEWEDREKEKEKIVLESYGLYQEDPFLTSYYTRLDEIKKERIKHEEMRKLEPPKLVVQLEFNETRQTSDKKYSSNAIETYGSVSSNGLSIFDKNETFLDLFRNPKDTVRGKEPELLIKIRKGKNLLNRMKEDQPKYGTSKAACSVHPDITIKHGAKLKTKNIYVSKKGTAKWNHVIVIKGFTVEQLLSKHVTIEVSGKNDNGRTVIGQIVLAGPCASISVPETNQFRPPNDFEAHPWCKALEKPGTSVTATLDVLPPEAEISTEKSIGEMLKHEFNKDILKLHRMPSMRRRRNR